MDNIKNILEIIKDLLEIFILGLTAWQLGKPKDKDKRKSRRRK